MKHKNKRKERRTAIKIKHTGMASRIPAGETGILPYLVNINREVNKVDYNGELK